MVYNPFVYFFVGFLFGTVISVGLYVQNKIIQEQSRSSIRRMERRLLKAFERYGWKDDEF